MPNSSHYTTIRNGCPTLIRSFDKSGSITVRVGNRKWDNRGFTILLIRLATKRIREMGHVTRVEKKKINANCLLDSKCQGRRPLRRLRVRPHKAGCRGGQAVAGNHGGLRSSDARQGAAAKRGPV